MPPFTLPLPPIAGGSTNAPGTPVPPAGVSGRPQPTTAPFPVGLRQAPQFAMPAAYTAFAGTNRAY